MSVPLPIQPHFHKLLSLTRSHLTRLARLTGVSVSGTKSELTERLLASWQQPKLRVSDIDRRTKNTALRQENGRNDAHRVLSIDMGIRNLAFCRLLVSQGDDKSVNDTTILDTSSLGPMSVEKWRRYPLGSKVPSLRTKVSEDEESPPVTERELFTQPVLAGHAVSLLRDLVLYAPEGPPDTILIERQRWRSGGHASVQEWTLRVNTMEAMLWSGLAMLQDQGVWSGSVHAVDPGAVTRFWVNDSVSTDENDSGIRQKREAREAKGKRLKINVARQWISEGVIVQEAQKSQLEVDLRAGYKATSPGLEWEDSAIPMRDVFYEARASKKLLDAAGVESDDFRTNKKDDLADCLLQAVAWVKWEQNRRAIIGGRASLDGNH